MNVTEAVHAIHERGEYPSAGRIQRERGQRVTHNINGRDCKEREAALLALGYERKVFDGGYTARWWPPAKYPAETFVPKDTVIVHIESNATPAVEAFADAEWLTTNVGEYHRITFRQWLRWRSSLLRWGNWRRVNGRRFWRGSLAERQSYEFIDWYLGDGEP